MAKSQVSYARLGEYSSTQTLFLGTTEAPQEPSSGTTNSRDKHKVTLCLLGVTELFLALLMIGLAITTVCMTIGLRGGYGYARYNVYATYPAQGLWGGVFVALTGMLGVRAKRNPSVSMYNANMVMSMVTATILTGVVTLSGIASTMNFAVSFHILITIFSFVAMVICIVHSAYCCAGVCRQSKQYQGVMVSAPQQYEEVVGLRLANGQHTFPVGNTVMPQQYGHVMATSAQVPTAVNFQSPQSQFAQQTILRPQATVDQPTTLNSPSIQDNSFANGVAENPSSYTTLPKN